MKIRILVLLGMLFANVRAVTQTIYLSMSGGPFDKNQVDSSISYTLESTYTSSKWIYEIFRFGDNSNPNMQSVTKTSHLMSPKSTYSESVTVPTKDLLGSSGMKITVEIYNGNGSMIRSCNCYIYPRSPGTINPTTYSSNTYSSPQIRFEITDNVTRYPSETYRFTKVDDYFLTDIYYRLTLEQFEMETSLSDSEFTYASANLQIIGMRDYFPGLTYQRNTANIPLKINCNNGKLTLSLKDNLFVEPKLLIMSSTAKVNYMATKNFYLPVNHAKDLVGSSFRIQLLGIGYNKTSFIWDSSLLADSPLIGDCNNSGYCVVGTVTK